MTTPYDTYKTAILGVPFDPNKQPSRQGAVKAFSEMQQQLEGAQAGALVKSTLVDLQSLTEVSEASIMAWVTNDSVKTQNGIYENIGTATLPEWEKRAEIPQTMISAANVSGSANAIEVTTDLNMPDENGRALLSFFSVYENTDEVTVSINGGDALNVKSSTGNILTAGSILSGMLLIGVKSGNSFYLLSDVNSAINVSASEQHASAAAISESNASTHNASALVARDIAVSAANASSPVKIALTKAEALAASYTTNDVVEVQIDETRQNQRVRYKWDGSSLNYILTMNKDNDEACNLSDFGFVPNLSTSITAAITSAKAAGFAIGIAIAGVYPINAASAWENFEVRGVGQGQTIFDISAFASGNAFNLGTYGKLSKVTIQGPYDETDMRSPATPWFETIDDVVNFNNIGVVNAIYKDHVMSLVEDVEIIGVTGWAITNGRTNSGPLFGNHSGVRNCRIHNNYGGIYDPSDPALPSGQGAEYLHHAGNTINDNVIGVAVQGGNNTFDANKIDHNEAGVVLIGGHNDSHGSFTGGSINHSRFVTIIADEIGAGELFTGVSMFDGGTFGIYFRKSRGVKISACALSKMNIYAEGVYEGNILSAASTGPGVNVIHDCNFVLHGVNYQVHRNVNDETDNLVMYDNFLLEGSSYHQNTTWDESIVNTDHLDRFGWSETNENGFKGLRGKPIDAFAKIGSGNQAGALKIKLPYTFPNALIGLRVRSVGWTTARDNIDYTIQGYALASGSVWTGVHAQRSGEILPIRFGKDDVDNKIVIYIGELNSSWRDAIFEVTEFSVHQASTSVLLKKYWVNGWELSLENSTFDNVTQKIEGFEFSGDLDLIDWTGDHYVLSSSANKPGSLAGWLRSLVRQPTSATRMQEFTDTLGDTWSRTRNGSTWNAWLKHTP